MLALTLDISSRD